MPRNLEVIALPNGHFTVQATGVDALEFPAGEFGTREEAENWMFSRVQEMDAQALETDVIKPSQGQGVA